MTEIENGIEEVEKRIEKARIGLIACAVLVAILVVSSVWLYTRIGGLQNRIDTLESEKSNLQSQVSNLETDKNQFESQASILQSEINSLISDYNSLVSEYNDYVANHQFTDEQYYGATFSYYYISPVEQRFGVYNLSDELYGLELFYPYEEDVFDCSEMSAYLEWYLENEGWHTTIILGDAPFGGGYHAWLLVETSTDHYMPVESTTIEIVWWDDPYFDNYFTYEYEFETILDALAYSETEFDWWK